MAIRNSLIEAYGLNSPGKNLLDHAGNHDYQSFGKAIDNENTQIVYDNINNYVSVTQPEDVNLGIYRTLNSIVGGIYNLSFYAYSDTDCDFLFGIASASEVFGSSLHVNAREWTKCWCVGKASNTTIAFYANSPSFKIRNIKFTKCSSTDCYFFQYTDINDELKPFVYNFKDLQTNCRYTEYFTNDNPINELISWENFKYLLKEFVEYEEWQYSDDKSYRTRNTISIIDWCDGSNKSSVSNTEREDATIEYGTPELTLVVNDIPASGGTISNGTVSYGQSKYYVYSDVRFKVTDESGIITDGLTWGDPVTAQSLGTTIKNRSIVGSLTVSTTINGKTESTTADVYQQANRIESYGTPTGRTLSVSDIPASGGTVSRGTLGGTITQSCTYTSGSNGTLTNPTIISSSYSASITAESLGTTIKDRTKIGTLTYTYVCNKKTGSVSADVYQQANNATDITYGDWTVSLSANKYTTSSSPAPAGGGTAVITSSASRTRTQNYTSGATSKLSNETATPTLSISGTGFSLSGTTVTVANRSNVEGNQRTASVTATISGVTKSITLYQALNKITSITATGAASSYEVMNISAGGGTVTWTPTITYSSGWSGNPPSGVTISYSASGSVAIQSGNVTTWPSRGITIGPWRGSDITISAKSAYTTTAVTGVVSTGQNLNTINDINITNGLGSTPVTSVGASGGTVEIFPRLSFSSGEYQFVLNYSKLGSWSGTGTGFTVSDITASSSTGRRIVAASRGTSIGADRSITSTYTLNTTINGVAINKSATHKYTQALNTVTSIDIRACGGAEDPPQTNYPASRESHCFSFSCRFSSGLDQEDSVVDGLETWSFNQSWGSWAPTAENRWWGNLIVSSRGTIIGPARSGTLTCTLKGTINGVSINASDSVTITQALNKVESCTVLKNELSYPAIAAAGGTSNPVGAVTVTYNYSSGATGSPQGTTTTISYSMPATSGFSINTSSGVVTATNNTSTNSRTSGTVTRTVTNSYTNPSSVGGDTVSATLTKTATCTQSAGVKTYANPVVSLSYATIPAKGGTVSPTLSYSQTWGWNGATSGGGTITSGATVSYSGTSVNTINGSVTAASKGTTVSNITTVTTATATVTLNGKSGSKSATIQQSGNYVTNLSIVASSLSYPTISAGATSATPTMSGGSITFTYSSGSTSGDAPTATYGTFTTTRKYTLGSVINGFTAVNVDTGVLTATNRGTTIGPARTSGIVTYTVTRTWTPTSSYNAAGTKTDTDSKTATCTQALNTIISMRIFGLGPSTPITSVGAAASTFGYTGVATFSTGIEAELNNYASYVSYSFNQSWGTWTSSGYYGVLSIASRGTTIGAARTGTLTCTISGTINGVSVNKSGTLTITQALNTVISSKIVPMSGSASDVNFPASGAARGFVGELTLSSGSKIQGLDYRNYITYSLTSTFGTWTPNGEKYYGSVTVASRGTVEGAQKSGTLTHKIVGTINGVSVNKTATLALTQAANEKSYEYSNLVGHIQSTSWNKNAYYTSFWATGDYIERYTSGATGESGTNKSIPWDSVTTSEDWCRWNDVQGEVVYDGNTGLQRKATITGRIGSWTYSVEVTQAAGMEVGKLTLVSPVSIGFAEYWNITVRSTANAVIYSGGVDAGLSSGNRLVMTEECAAAVALNPGTVSFSTTYSTGTDRQYRGSISGTEQDQLKRGEDVTVYLS